jgi:hypothetical protein
MRVGDNVGLALVFGVLKIPKDGPTYKQVMCEGTLQAACYVVPDSNNVEFYTFDVI